MVVLKKSAASFVEDLKENIEYFQAEMERNNFSNRNDREWFKLLSDYLGITSNNFSKDDSFDDHED